jgi:hypothetical protein
MVQACQVGGKLAGLFASCKRTYARTNNPSFTYKDRKSMITRWNIFNGNFRLWKMREIIENPKLKLSELKRCDTFILGMKLIYRNSHHFCDWFVTVNRVYLFWTFSGIWLLDMSVLYKYSFQNNCAVFHWWSDLARETSSTPANEVTWKLAPEVR